MNDADRRLLQHKEAQDSRHSYEWSPHGILVRENRGEWTGYYAVRNHAGDGTPPTRLVLTGIGFGEPTGELGVDFVTLGDIDRHIVEGSEPAELYTRFEL